jgi:hypothetical protein
VVAQADAAGTVGSETYDSCGRNGTAATENAVSLIEKEVPFSGTYFQGTHAVVRNASGNDYQAPTGTTPFRIQQVPVPGPAPGASRASVMDTHPWTYLVSAQECSRWYTDASVSPLSPQIGDPRQYAIVDLGAQVHDIRATAVAIQLQGASTWYLSDLGSGYPLHDGGHGRTAVKLPVGWQNRRITGVRVLAYPAGPEPSVGHVSVEVLAPDHRLLFDRPSGACDPLPALPRFMPVQVVPLHRTFGAEEGAYFPNQLAFTMASSDGTGIRYRAEAVQLPGGILVTAVALGPDDQTLASLVHVEIIVSASVLLAAVIVALLVTRVGLRSLRDMTDAAGAIAGGDLSRRIRRT